MASYDECVKVRTISPVKFGFNRLRPINPELLSLNIDELVTGEMVYRLTATIYAETAGYLQSQRSENKMGYVQVISISKMAVTKSPAEYKKTTVTFKQLFPTYCPAEEQLGKSVPFYELNRMPEL